MVPDRLLDLLAVVATCGLAMAASPAFGSPEEMGQDQS